MIPKTSDILAQKVSEIQSRLPVKIKGFESAESFNEILEANSYAGEPAAEAQRAGVSASETGVRAANVARAKAALASSNAYIPGNRTERLEIINTNLESASKTYGIDYDLLRAVVKLESGFDPYAISHAGAQGLMQLMPGTADGLGVTDPFDIAQNIDGGARYLRDQLINFGGDVELALAAYNAGPGSVKKYQGIPPYEETQNYVRLVMDYYRQYGFSGSR